jgi:hypothetical protein
MQSRRATGRSSTTATGAALALALAASACTGGADPGSGVTAYLRAAGGQFAPGELSATTPGDGPVINIIRSNSTVVFPGAAGRALSGSAAPTASAVLLGLSGDSGHWILPTGAEDFDFPGSFTFMTTASYSPETPLGSYSLVFRATDAAGVVGPPKVLALTVASSVPAGALTILLEWDADADLDLKLRMPDVNTPGKFDDVWNKSPLALPPPSSSSEPPPTNDEIKAAGKLDFDSNAQCRIDGTNRETIVFPNPPPPGMYQVRVDAFSMCGVPSTRWHAIAVANAPGGQTLGEANGQMSDQDTLGNHGPESGTLAFSFSIM